jgi:hypothetical protein
MWSRPATVASASMEWATRPERPHRALGLGQPLPGAHAGSDGRIIRRDILGGLIHEYERAA